MQLRKFSSIVVLISQLLRAERGACVDDAPNRASTAHGLFASGTTLVLMSGLAGDLESASRYNEQMRAWLARGEAAGIQRAYVLSDEPQSADIPTGARKLGASRESFLGLSNDLSSARGPVTFVVWGHAGLQGATPVFHVRGPRLTAQDFKTVASAAGKSTWVLVFRGSGSFARELDDPGRRILSSDAGNQFSSDPVGMDLLLKQLSEKPDQPLDALAIAWGRATRAWYNERSLARMEEPVLWNGSGEPRPLAREPANNAGAIPEAASNSLASAKTPPPQTNKVSPATGIWKELKKVDSADFPDADGVLLRRSMEYTVGSQPALRTEQDEFIQILQADGKRLGDFDISFAPPAEEFELLECEVQSPSGELTRLPPEDVREAREPDVGEYQFGRRKFFSLPGVVPGAVLHLHYRTEWKEFPLPRVSLEIPLQAKVPILHQEVRIRVPNGTPFHFAIDGAAARDPEISRSAYGQTYAFKFDNVSERENGPLIAPDEQTRLLISTFKDWAEFGQWYSRISRLADEPDPELAAKARELTGSAGSDMEKVRAIYNYVVALRYVAVPLGVNSVRPHAAARVFENQFGDCKDKANLFNTLLKTLNLKSQLVLVPRFKQAHEEVPGLSFNHAISCVRLNSETLWLDTTDDVCRFGLLPPGDAGRNVLVIDDKMEGLTRLPIPKANEHELKLEGRIDLGASPVPMALKVSAKGYPDYMLRFAAQSAHDRGGRGLLLSTKFRALAGSFAMKAQKASAASALDEDFSWSADGEWLGGRVETGSGSLISSPFWVPKEWDLALEQRKSGLFLNEGYPGTLDERFELSLPAGTQPVHLPGVQENGQGPLRWNVQWARIGADKLTAHFHAELERGELSLAQTHMLQKQLRELLTQLASGAAIRASP